MTKKKLKIVVLPDHKNWIKSLMTEIKNKPWYLKLWHWKINPILRAIKSEVRSWPFRIKNKFDYRDTWSLDYSIAKFTLPRLKYLRNHKHGYPNGLTHKKWLKILDKMIYSFVWILDEAYLYDKKTDKKIQEGLDLFGKYFRALWD